MMKFAGILLMIAGILLCLAFLFQLPYLYYVLKGEMQASHHASITGVLYRFFLLIAGVALLFIGRKVKRSSF